MAVPTQLSDLSATAASNSPAGGDTVGTTMDDYIRAIQSIIVRISAGTDAMATPNIGAATGTSLVLSGLATVNGAFTSLGLDDNATAKALTLSGSGANSVTIANSATNPTIGTSAGALLLAPATGFVQLNGVTTSGLLLNAATGNSALVAMYVNGTEVARIIAGAAENLLLGTSSTGTPQVSVTHTASANRYITLTGSNGGNPTIGTSAGGLQLNGSGGTGLLIDSSGNVGLNTIAGFSAISKGLEIQDASVNVGLRVERTGTGASIGELFAADGIVRLNTAGAIPIGFGTNNAEQVRVTHTASANQYITLTGDVSNGPRISVGGAANANLYLSSGAGTGSIGIYTNNVGSEQVRITHTASADRYITLTGSNGGNPTIGTSAGSLAISSAVVGASTITAGTNIFANGYAQFNYDDATPAGGAANTGLFLGVSAMGVYFGSGAPTVSAAKGSIYLRSDGTTTNNRMYVNTDGSTTWTAVTTVA